MTKTKARLVSLGVAGLILGWFVVLAPAASAHHAVLSGTTACSANGEHVVTWTIANSETTSGTNRTMTITAISVNRGTLVGVSAPATFPPVPTAGSSKQATTTIPGAQTGSVTLTVTASWPYPGPHNVVKTATVELGGACTQPTTTTTHPPTTTTTVPPTTTTTVPATTTTTAPATTTTTVQSTTTTTAAVTTTTVGVSVLGEEITRGDSLPRTGGQHFWWLGMALAAIVGTVGAQALRRRVGAS